MDMSDFRRQLACLTAVAHPEGHEGRLAGQAEATD
jgi:hypothetical protein